MFLNKIRYTDREDRVGSQKRTKSHRQCAYENDEIFRESHTWLGATFSRLKAKRPAPRVVVRSSRASFGC
jgi:hypothetical protein